VFKVAKMTTDWTDNYDQNLIAKIANNIIDEIIDTIHKSKLQIFKHNKLTLFDIGILIRWPLYIGVNTFIERLLRVKVNLKINHNIESYLSDKDPDYYDNTIDSVRAYYQDYTINFTLMNSLSKIILDSAYSDLSKGNHLQNPRKIIETINTNNNIKNIFKNIYYSAEKLYILIIKPKLIGDRSNWFRGLFIFGHSIDFDKENFSKKSQDIDLVSRGEIKNICYQVMQANIQHIIDIKDNRQADKLASLFSEWIDHSIPRSIIEKLKNQIVYYKNMLRNWHVDQLHSFTGYFYSDNLKIFAILVRRQGALLVGHTHGANNYASSYKCSNELRFLDYYTTYGKNITDSLLSHPGLKQVKFLPVGSILFHKLKKWKKKKLSNTNLKLLYASGPMRFFMSDLQEISPEKRLEHRLEILSFLEQLLMNYPKIKIIYKPFPGTYNNDPIRANLSRWFDGGQIVISDKSPHKIFNKVDAVLWDSISTGFAESINAGVPTIVFNSKSEYELASPNGKVVNNNLTENGVQCYNKDDAINSFKLIIKDPENYKRKSQLSIKKYIDDYAYPVSKKEWHNNFNHHMKIKLNNQM
jgi:putative transferase (TIGR04331 family)